MLYERDIYLSKMCLECQKKNLISVTHILAYSNTSSQITFLDKPINRKRVHKDTMVKAIKARVFLYVYKNVKA